MGTHLQEFSSYPSEVPTDYHKVASANPGVICETQHLGSPLAGAQCY
jgi:hypothetical protein